MNLTTRIDYRFRALSIKDALLKLEKEKHKLLEQYDDAKEKFILTFKIFDIGDKVTYFNKPYFIFSIDCDLDLTIITYSIVKPNKYDMPVKSPPLRMHRNLRAEQLTLGWIIESDEIYKAKQQQIVNQIEF